MLSREVPFSEFMDDVESGRVSSVRLDGEIIDVVSETGEKYRVVRPIGNDVVTPLRENNIEIQAVKPSPVRSYVYNKRLVAIYIIDRNLDFSDE